MELKVNTGICPVKSNNTKVEAHYADGEVMTSADWHNHSLWEIDTGPNWGDNITHYRILTPEHEYIQ